MVIDGNIINIYFGSVCYTEMWKRGTEHVYSYSFFFFFFRLIIDALILVQVENFSVYFL